MGAVGPVVIDAKSHRAELGSVARHDGFRAKSVLSCGVMVASMPWMVAWRFLMSSRPLMSGARCRLLRSGFASMSATTSSATRSGCLFPALSVNPELRGFKQTLCELLHFQER